MFNPKPIPMQIYRIILKHVIKKQKKYRDPSRTAILQACGILAYKMMMSKKL